MRRAYISGFTGSAGIAIVTKDKAALWTDGRYFLQVLLVNKLYSHFNGVLLLSSLVQYGISAC